MRVLVSGAAGFLGRNFVRHHVAAGDFVFGIDDLSNSHSIWPEELEATNRMVMDAGRFFSGAKSKYDLAYHFAAPVGGRLRIEGDPLFNADSLRLDAAFFRWAVDHVTTAVYPSSSAVYGTRFQDVDGIALSEDLLRFDFNEDMPIPDEMYGFTKLAGEMLAWKSAAYGLNVLCIRPFSGYGEDQSSEYPVPSIAARVAHRENPLTIWGSGQQTRDFVHVDDLVGATLSRLEVGIRGFDSMNIGSGRATSFHTVAEMLVSLQSDYDPLIVTDTSKPEGVAKRWASTARMARYYRPTIPLLEGLDRVLQAQADRVWPSVAG